MGSTNVTDLVQTRQEELHIGHMKPTDWEAAPLLSTGFINWESWIIKV